MIGRGGFGKVWKVKDKNNGEELACKEMSKLKLYKKNTVKTISLKRNTGILDTLIITASFNN